MPSRRGIGLCAAGLCALSIALAVRSLVANLRISFAEHALGLIGGSIVAILPFVVIAALLARLAYRNLFWGRYVASRRTQTEHPNAAPPNER